MEIVVFMLYYMIYCLYLYTEPPIACILHALFSNEYIIQSSLPALDTNFNTRLWYRFGFSSDPHYSAPRTVHSLTKRYLNILYATLYDRTHIVYAIYNSPLQISRGMMCFLHRILYTLYVVIHIRCPTRDVQYSTWSCLRRMVHWESPSWHGLRLSD